MKARCEFFFGDAIALRRKLTIWTFIRTLYIFVSFYSICTCNAKALNASCMQTKSQYVFQKICLHVVVASVVGFYYRPFNKISNPDTGAINQCWTRFWWQSLLSLPDSDQPWPVWLGTPVLRLCVLAKMTAVETVHFDMSSWHPCNAHDNYVVISSHRLL